MKLIFNSRFYIAIILFVSAVTKAQLKDANYIKLTSINYYDGDSKEANSLLAVLDKKYPNNAYILAEKGAWKYFGENNLNEGLSIVSNALQLSPKNDKAYHLRSIMFFNKGLLDKAIEDGIKALEINPEPIDYYIQLGSYYYMNKNYENAQSIFLKGLEQHPADSNIYKEIFAANAGLKKTTETNQLFNNGIAKDGMNKVALRSSYANFFMRLSDFKNAAVQYEILLKESESKMTSDDFNSAAVSYNKLRNYERSLYFIDKAIAMKEDASFYTNRADSAFELYKYELLVDSANKAIELEPNNGIAYMYLALAYKWGYKDLEKSAFYEKKARELNPEFK